MIFFLFRELWDFPIQWTRLWSLFSHTLSLGIPPTENFKKLTIVVKVTMASATSGSVWGFGVGSRNICTMEGRGEKVESLSNCLASLVTTKCWQVLPSTCLPLVLVCLCCEARKSWPKAYASFKLLLVFVTLQLLLLIAKTSLCGCTTLNCKPAGMS